MASEPENIWNKRAAAWVYYEYLKKFSQPDSLDSFKENLTKIKDLDLPEDEKMVFDNCAWQLGSVVFGLQRAVHLDYAKVNELFEIIKNFHFTKPSEAYTFIYKAFHRGYQNWSKYLNFADWWNFENFRSEDYLKEEFNGKMMMSIAEQAYIAYSKKLLEGELLEPFGHQREIDKDQIKNFLPQLDSIIEAYPQFTYLPYYKAKLLISLGGQENVFSAIFPFARQMRKSFWVWTAIADTLPSNDKRAFACYCKALSLDTPPQYLVKVRQKLAALLIDRKMFEEAAIEVNKTIETRKSFGWKITKPLSKWRSQEWFTNTDLNKQSNRKLYMENAPIADDLIFGDIPETLIVIDAVSKKSKIAKFVKDQSNFGTFRYSDFFNQLNPGDLLLVKFWGAPKGKQQQVVSAHHAPNDTNSTLIKDFNGKLTVIASGGFGFAANVFIPPNLINRHHLESGSQVAGKAILSYNTSKKKMDWKAVSIHK